MNKETTPKQQPLKTATVPDPAFGWTTYAEQVNGRFAMAGFTILLGLEFFTKQDIITWLGLR